MRAYLRGRLFLFQKWAHKCPWLLIPMTTPYEAKLLNQVYQSCLSGSLTNTKTIIWIRTTISKVQLFINKIDLEIPLHTRLNLPGGANSLILNNFGAKLQKKDWFFIRFYFAFYKDWTSASPFHLLQVLWP